MEKVVTREEILHERNVPDFVLAVEGTHGLVSWRFCADLPDAVVDFEVRFPSTGIKPSAWVAGNRILVLAGQSLILVNAHGTIGFVHEFEAPVFELIDDPDGAVIVFEIGCARLKHDLSGFQWSTLIDDIVQDFKIAGDTITIEKFEGGDITLQLATGQPSE